MSNPMYDEIERAQADLERSQHAIAEIQQQMAGTATTVTSKNRAISVIVNSQGELVAIKFLTRSYRLMPSAELGTLLVDTIGDARQQALAQTASLFQAVLPASAPVLDMIKGTVDLDEMMREAIRQVNEDRPGASATGDKGTQE